MTKSKLVNIKSMSLSEVLEALENVIKRRVECPEYPKMQVAHLANAKTLIETVMSQEQ